MKLQKPRCGWFASHTARTLDYERELHRNKIMECMDLRRENRELRETVIKQRIALDALNEAHSHDAKAMEDQMAALRYQVSIISAERDRYRSALRRNFPSQLEVMGA